MHPNYWIVLAIFAAFVGVCGRLIQDYRNRPDRKLAREIRDCAKAIREHLELIRKHQRRAEYTRSSDYADHMRLHEWPEVKEEFLLDQIKRKQRYHDDTVIAAEKRLVALVRRWERLVERYKKQNDSADVKGQLLKQIDTKEGQIEEQRAKTKRAEAELEVLKKEYERIEGRDQGYRLPTTETQPIKTRVAPEIAEIEVLLEENESKKRMST